MNFIYLTITTLTTAALAKGAMECNISETSEAQQCLGVVGEPLIFLLPTGENKKTTLKKNSDIIMEIKGDNISRVVIHSNYRNHSAICKNGRFKFETVTNTDSGDYTLETYTLSDGTLKHQVKVHLKIQAPVSKPVMSQVCLSPEQMRVKCSSEADGVEFTLTLDLTQHPGNLTCTANNSISREETFIHLTSCSGWTSQLGLVALSVMATVACELLLLVLFLGIKHFNKKKRTDPEPRTVNEDHTEIVYSAVRVKQKRY